MASHPMSCVAVLAAWAGIGLCASAWAQTPPLDGAALFKQQCSACHTLDASAPQRQGPTLAGVYGRKPGTVPGYQYTPDFATADFVWDDEHLDKYLTNPQALIPDSIMPYRQSKARVRQAIIAYLKEQPK